MTDIDEALRRTLEDGRLTRSERQALAALVAEQQLTHPALSTQRSRAFALAREALQEPRSHEVLGWLEGVIGVLLPPAADRGVAEACFSPGEGCPHRLAALLRGARSSLDICVFTITDDRLTRAIEDAHGQGVQVRIISDDQKSEALGSDVDRLAATGVAVRLDHSEHHMHHKFAILDGTALLTGSYNWTRAAALHNQENFLLTDDPRLVEAYARVFEELWQGYG